MKLSISIDGGTSWTKIWEAENDGEAWSWREISIDLSSYSNLSNIMLGWQYVGNDGDLAGIDNVEIKSTVTGITSQQKQSTSILFQNYPNPFNPSTTLEYQIPEAGNVKVSIFNIRGEVVKIIENGFKKKGNYKLSWNSQNHNGSLVASGIYFVQVKHDDKILTKKIMLLK